MAPDPYARYLQQAEELFGNGEIVRAGQIWQAVLKAVPDHGPAREGLLRVKAALEAQQAAEEAAEAAAAHRRQTDSSIEIPAFVEPAAEPQASTEPEVPREPEALPEPEVAAAPEPEPAPAPAPAMEPEDDLAAMLADLPDVLPPPPPEPERTAPIQALAPIHVPAPEAVSPAPQAPGPPPQAAGMDEDTQEKLLREGCTLYDMGQTEDALKKWNQLLAAVPDHAMALAYARGAREELGLPLEGPSASDQAKSSSEHPVTQEVPAYGADEEAADKLLREGCLLYDMGLPEEAIGKWEQAVKLAPHRSDIQSFLDNAHKDLAAGTIELAGSPAMPSPAASASNAPADEKVRQAEHLMGLQRIEEAAFTFQQALDLDPAHPQALVGLAKCRSGQPMPSPATPSKSSTGPIRIEPMRIEMDRPDPEPETPAPTQAPTAVQPPAALTKPAPAPRTGLQIKTPEALDPSKLPDWVKDPKVWVGAAAGILIIIVGTYWYKDYARDAQLKSDVDAAHQAAVAKAAKDALVPSVAETPASVLSEAQQALSQGDAVRAYLRAQSLVQKNPSNGPAAQLMDKAKAALAGGALVGATAEEFQQHLQEGDLDQAAKVMDSLLRASPDDAGLRTKALHLYLRLAEDHASQERWGDAQVDLLRARSLAPEDPAWSARLALLPKIQSLPRGDRALWITMLG